MNKQIFSVLLCSTFIFSGVFTSCSDDTDDLDSRLTVVELMLREIKTQLEDASLSGATITNASQDASGVWTLTLSSGQIIRIEPGAGGGSGGSGVTVVENENSITITIDGKNYELPFGAGLHSLVYAPEFADGEARTDKSGNVEVLFLVKPALNDATFKAAAFAVAAAHELKMTRALTDVSGYFEIGDVTRNGDYITVPFSTIEGAAAGKTFAVAIQMSLGGATYVSNYFHLAVDPSAVGLAENFTAPKLASSVTDLAEVAAGSKIYTATLPSTEDFLNGFNFRSLFSGLDANARFVLAPRNDANDNRIQNNNFDGHRYDIFNEALASNGAWELLRRPETAGITSEAGQYNGFAVDVIVGSEKVHRIYWKINDPIADIDFTGGLTTRSQHMEQPGMERLEAGANRVNLNQALSEGDFAEKHGDTQQFIDQFNAYQIMLGNESVVYNGGDGLELGSVGEKYLGKHAGGLVWENVQSSIIDQEGTEIIGGYDGVPTQEMWDSFHVRITPDGYWETGAQYTGIGWRAGMRVKYEYAFGTKYIGGDNVLAFVFFNRRPPYKVEEAPNLDPR